MKEEKLQLLRHRINVMKEELLKKEKKIRRLEATNEVKEYLLLRKLKNVDSKEYKFNEDNYIHKLLLNRYNFIGKDDETNNIYYSNDFVYSPDNKEVKYLYTDIESGKEVFVPENGVEEFEETHIVLETEEGYFKVCGEFLKDAIHTNQEEAVKRIIKKYGINSENVN